MQFVHLSSFSIVHHLLNYIPQHSLPQNQVQYLPIPYHNVISRIWVQMCHRVDFRDLTRLAWCFIWRDRSRSYLHVHSVVYNVGTLPRISPRYLPQQLGSSFRWNFIYSVDVGTRILVLLLASTVPCPLDIYLYTKNI